MRLDMVGSYLIEVDCKIVCGGHTFLARGNTLQLRNRPQDF